MTADHNTGMTTLTTIHQTHYFAAEDQRLVAAVVVAVTAFECLQHSHYVAIETFVETSWLGLVT